MATNFPMQNGRFKLRGFIESDLATLFEIESDATLKQFVGGPIKAPREDWIAKARTNIIGCDVQFALEEVSSGTLAGRVSLGHYESPNQREVQIILAKAFVGRGLGYAVCELACTYAFNVLGAVSVWAVVDPKHSAGINLVRRLGFSEEQPTATKRIFVLRGVA